MSNLSNILASIGKDKYIHFAVCLVLTLVIYAVASIWMGPAAVALGFVVAILAGIGKEFYDKKKTGLFDPYDIVADFLGAFLGVVIIALLLI